MKKKGVLRLQLNHLDDICNCLNKNLFFANEQIEYLREISIKSVLKYMVWKYWGRKLLKIVVIPSIGFRDICDQSWVAFTENVEKTQSPCLKNLLCPSEFFAGLIFTTLPFRQHSKKLKNDYSSARKMTRQMKKEEVCSGSENELVGFKIIVRKRTTSFF